MRRLTALLTSVLLLAQPASAFPDPGVSASKDLKRAIYDYLKGYDDLAQAGLNRSKAMVSFQTGHLLQALLDIEAGEFGKAQTLLKSVNTTQSDYGFFKPEQLRFMATFAQAKMALFKGKKGVAMRHFQALHHSNAEAPELKGWLEQVRYFRKQGLLKKQKGPQQVCHRSAQFLKSQEANTLKICLNLPVQDPQLPRIMDLAVQKGLAPKVYPFLNQTSTREAALWALSPQLQRGQEPLVKAINHISPLTRRMGLLSLKRLQESGKLSVQSRQALSALLIKQLKGISFKESDVYDVTRSLAPKALEVALLYENLLKLQSPTAVNPVTAAFLQSAKNALQNKHTHTPQNRYFHWIPEYASEDISHEMVDIRAHLKGLFQP